MAAIQAEYIDFTPFLTSNNIDISTAELIIERAIIEGSGGPDNIPITESGLRFVRFLLCLFADSNLPNLKNIDSIQDLAKRFIRRSTNVHKALNNMYAIMNAESCLMTGNNIG